MIKVILDKIFKCRKTTPSRKLCNDIQDDYWGFEQNNRYTMLDKKGFLDKKFCIKGKKYQVVSYEQVNTSFKIWVQNEEHINVFNMVILYGYDRDNNNRHILYIDRFYRLSDQREGVGKAMALYIRKLAENRGFDIIGVHAVAEYNAERDTMNQEQLEEFYNKYLNGDNVQLVLMENSDCVQSVDWDRRW